MNLILIRHGLSEQRESWVNDSLLSDNFRPLTKPGLIHFSKATTGLKKLISHIDFVYSSQLTRALQTAEILHGQFSGSQLITNKALNPGGNYKSIMTLLNRIKKSQDSDKTIALVGHNPDIGLLTHHLLGVDSKNCFLTFKKGGMSFIHFNSNKVKLQWHMTQEQISSLFL